MRINKLIQKYSFLALGIALSLPIWLQSKIVFLFIIIQVLIAFVNKYRFSRKGSHIAILLIMLYLSGIFSLIYSTNLDFGLNKLTTQLSLLLLPGIAILYGKERINDMAPNFYMGVIAGNIFLLLYISLGMIYSFLFGELDFVSSNSIRILDHLLENYNHRTYIGIILVAGYLAINSADGISGFKKHVWFRVLYALLIWVILFLLGARAILIIYSFLLVFQLYISMEIKKAFALSLIMVVAFGLLFSLHPRLSYFISSEFSLSEILQSNVRHDLWREAWNLIKESPVIGYGLGDGKGLMVESTAGIDKVIQLQLVPDAHNQFLQSWIDVGIIGPILILFILIVYVVKNKNLPILMRLGIPLLFSFAMLFEVILHRLSGVLVFTTILLFPPTKTSFSITTRKIFLVSLAFSSVLLILFGILSKIMNQFDPKEPLSYMSLKHSVIDYQELPGDVPESIPMGSKGCLLDKNSFEKELEGNLFAQSIIDEQNAGNGDSAILTVFCYISDAFNGDQVRLSGRGQIQKPNDHYANMDIRNEWQFLSINSNTQKGRSLMVLTVGKHQPFDIDSIKGEVIFVHPSMEIIKKKKLNKSSPNPSY